MQRNEEIKVITGIALSCRHLNVGRCSGVKSIKTLTTESLHLEKGKGERAVPDRRKNKCSGAGHRT